VVLAVLASKIGLPLGPERDQQALVKGKATRRRMHKEKGPEEPKRREVRC
jgi:hypothetical protein